MARRGRGRRAQQSSQRRCISESLRQLVTIALTIVVTIKIMRSDREPHTMENMPDPHAEDKGILGNALGAVNEALGGKGEPPFQKSKYDYALPTVATEHTLPDPVKTNQTTVVIVLSARKNFERRSIIRDSWAKKENNVYFVIGGHEPDDMGNQNRSNPLSVSSLLFKEQELYGDIIDTIHPDSYKSLPFKLHFATKWVVKNCPQVNWIAKADDDHIVRVRLLQFFVLRKFNPHHPIVIGEVVVNAPPHRHGKWAEDPHFKEAVYPPWAYGSSGYIMSRAVAQYIADQDNLYYYQGEDAGLGIWLAESPLQITFIDTPEVIKGKNCDPRFYIIGHNWGPLQIKECFDKIGDNVPERKNIVAFAAGRKDQHPQKIVSW